jgi:hypothetical protein
MSTFPRPDRGGELYSMQGGHVLSDIFEAIAAEFRSTISAVQDLDFLGHYSNGVLNRSIDRLAKRAASDLVGRFGRTLSAEVRELDRTLLDAGTGGLIRTVVHTPEGVAFCTTVTPGETVVGVMVGDSAGDLAAVIRVDMAVSELTTTLRRTVSLSSLNPGGWESGERTARTSAPSAPVVRESSPLNDGARRILQLCQELVSPVDLHLVALCKLGKVVFMADHLDDESLAPFFTSVAVAKRREFYDTFAPTLDKLVARCNRATNRVFGGLINRMVLDVEQGAVYYYRLKTGEYLVGVTIDQTRVAHADDRMSQLAAAARDIVAE